MSKQHRSQGETKEPPPKRGAKASKAKKAAKPVLTVSTEHNTAGTPRKCPSRRRANAEHAVAIGRDRRSESTQPKARSHVRLNGVGFGQPGIPTEFTLRPSHLPPYLPIDVGMEAMGRDDEKRLHKEAARRGFESASVRATTEAGQAFAALQLYTAGLPMVVWFGGKEIRRGSKSAAEIDRGIAPLCMALGLLGVSGVAGGGDGAMSICQRMHGKGIRALYPTRYRRLFPKAGIAGVTLSIEEEAPNPFVTPDWMTMPTRSLMLRTLRLMRVGVPVLFVVTEGGDSTFLEFFAVKALTKPGIIEQTDTPFEQVRPEIVFVENEQQPIMGPFLEWYTAAMVRGEKGRIARKRAEAKRLCSNLIFPSKALAGAKMAIDRLDAAAAAVYGEGLVSAWERVNHMEGGFWQVVEDLFPSLLRSSRS